MSDNDRDIILAQWQTCVEMANSISQRRDTMNNIFVTLNLAVVATIQYDVVKKSLPIMIIGILFCLIWGFLIHHYKFLNSKKFEVINEMEKELPSKPFSDEWTKLKKSRWYIDTSCYEYLLPTIFIIAHVCNIFIINS